MREVTRKEIITSNELRPPAKLILLMMLESNITRVPTPQKGSQEIGLSPKTYIDAVIELNKFGYLDSSDDGLLAVRLNEGPILMDAVNIRKFFAFKYKEKWNRTYSIFPKDLLAAYKLSMSAQDNLQERIVEYIGKSDQSATVYSFSKGVLSKRRLVIKSLKVNRLGKLL